MRLREAAVACREARTAGRDAAPGDGLRVFPFNTEILAWPLPETPCRRPRLDKTLGGFDIPEIGRPACFVGRAGDVTDGGPAAAERAEARARPRCATAVPVDPSSSPALPGSAADGIKIHAMPVDREVTPRREPARDRGAAAPAAGAVPRAGVFVGAAS